MKVWKLNQHHFNMVFGDITEPRSKVIKTISSKDEIVYQAIRYFNTRDPVLYYPSKSYSVAIIYSRLLELHFNENFYECLDDPVLLYGNDDYFRPYSQSKDIYDEVINVIGLDFDMTNGWVSETIRYFNEECLGIVDYNLLNGR